jgi:HEAT repeat protein
MPPASAGSHSELHRVVRALLDGVNARYAKNPREWTCPHMQALDDMTQSEPLPTLTDEEREAIDRLCRAVARHSALQRIRGLKDPFADEDEQAYSIVRGWLARLT